MRSQDQESIISPAKGFLYGLLLISLIGACFTVFLLHRRGAYMIPTTPASSVEDAAEIRPQMVGRAVRLEGEFQTDSRIVYGYQAPDGKIRVRQLAPFRVKQSGKRYFVVLGEANSPSLFGLEAFPYLTEPVHVFQVASPSDDDGKLSTQMLQEFSKRQSDAMDVRIFLRKLTPVTESEAKEVALSSPLEFRIVALAALAFLTIVATGGLYVFFSLRARRLLEAKMTRGFKDVGASMVEVLLLTGFIAAIAVVAVRSLSVEVTCEFYKVGQGVENMYYEATTPFAEFNRCCIAQGYSIGYCDGANCWCA